MDGPQPALRPGDEGQRRHDHQHGGVIEAAQPGADQSHIMIKRQPADEHIVGRDFHVAAHGPDVGQQVGVGEDHALGVAGTARGIL